MEIISRQLMRERGYEACAAGKGRNDHHMNPGAAAIAEWHAGWDQCFSARTAKPAPPPSFQPTRAAKPSLDCAHSTTLTSLKVLAC